MNEDKANSLLSLGWKVVSVRETPVFSSDVGFFRVKRYQSGTKLIYVMGCPNDVAPMTKEERESYFSVSKYIKRMESKGEK